MTEFANTTTTTTAAAAVFTATNVVDVDIDNNRDFVNERISDLQSRLVVDNNNNNDVDLKLLLEDAKIPNESNAHFYERYLKSNLWNTQAAFEHIQQTIQWRQSTKVTQLGQIENPDIILLGNGGEEEGVEVGPENNNDKSRSIEDDLLKKFPMSHLRSNNSGSSNKNNNYNIYRDSVGRPIFWYKIGAMDVAGLLEIADIDNLVRYFIWRFEQMVQIIGEDLLKSNDDDNDDDSGPTTDDDDDDNSSSIVVVDKWVVIMDLEGFSMFTHFNRTTVDVLTRINNLCASYYPETLSKLVVINSPYMFKKAWAVIKPLIKPTTQAKISISSHCPKEEDNDNNEDQDLIEYYEASKKVALSFSIAAS